MDRLRQRTPLATLVWIFACAFVLGACDGSGTGDAQADQGSPPPPPVEVASPLVKSVVEWDEYTGRFEAVERVELRARVSGSLESVHFQDGQTVNKGDLLFVIDPRPYEAELARANGELAQARSRLALTQAELNRAQRLLQSKTISRGDFDTREANQGEANAQIAMAQAAVIAAELNLEFTRITAPVSGRISDRKVDVGNLISGGAAQSTLLATIVSLDPIYFVFDASEADYLRYTRLEREGRRVSSRKQANPVYVRLMDETAWAREGAMNFVDNELAPGTGTIRGRAIFDNPDLVLTPGIFGRLRLIGSGEYEAMLLPDTAIISDQSQKLVLTVDDDGIVQAKPVTLGPVVEGLRVVRAGIDADARVIINGLQRARPGSPVTPEPGAFEAVGEASTPAAAEG